MKYSYRGLTVESGRKLDSALFHSDAEKAEKPTAEPAEKTETKKPAKKAVRK